MTPLLACADGCRQHARDRPLFSPLHAHARQRQRGVLMRVRPSSRRWLVVAAALAAGALSCRVAFVVIGSHVDAHGVLREPFALLPISALLLLSSGVVFIAARVLRCRRP